MWKGEGWQRSGGAPWIRWMGLLVLIGVLAYGIRYRQQGVSRGLELQPEDYATARKHFQTRLIRHGPAPQQGAPLQALRSALLVKYAKKPDLLAWLTPPPTNTSRTLARKPAVLFLHGGFAMGSDDWEMTQPFREAGYVVMAPALRGENGQEGDYSMFYNEVDDVVKAADYLASLPYVDKTHLYVAGHSVGGTLALLAAMTVPRFRAAASFSGSPDQIAWSNGQPELVPFDPGTIREFQMRSPIAFAASFQCPVRIYYGSREALFRASSEKLASLAKQGGRDAVAVRVEGDHFSAVPEAMQQSIRFFQSR